MDNKSFRSEICVGSRVFMDSIEEDGIVKKIREDVFGEPIIDVRRSDGILQICRPCEISVPD